MVGGGIGGGKRAELARKMNSKNRLEKKEAAENAYQLGPKNDPDPKESSIHWMA
jgi:hypothetical protein